MSAIPSNLSLRWSALRSRPLELFYILFLVSHFLIAVFIDMQPLYPDWIYQNLFPEWLKGIPENYLAMTGDPLVRSLGSKWKGRVNEYTWFWALSVGLEGLVQIPTTLLAAYGLWQGTQTSWITLLVYGSTTAMSVVPCLATIWNAPPPGHILSDPTMASISDYHKKLIIGSYLPFFIIPLWMAGDASLRLYNIVSKAEASSPSGANAVKLVKVD